MIIFVFQSIMTNSRLTIYTKRDWFISIWLYETILYSSLGELVNLFNIRPLRCAYTYLTKIVSRFGCQSTNYRRIYPENSLNLYTQPAFRAFSPSSCSNAEAMRSISFFSRPYRTAIFRHWLTAALTSWIISLA